MQRKSKKVSLPLSAEEVNNISESQRKHYSKLGYKPYLSHSGKIKWLSFDQHTYETIKYANTKKTFSFGRFQPKSPKINKYLRSLIRIFLDNWVLILLLFLIILLLLNINPIISYLSTLNL